MGTVDYIAILAILIVVGGAIFYIVRDQMHSGLYEKPVHIRNGLPWENGGSCPYF